MDEHEEFDVFEILFHDFFLVKKKKKKHHYPLELGQIQSRVHYGKHVVKQAVL